MKYFKFLVLLAAGWAFLLPASCAQDLYDYPHSQQFARYLMSSRQFHLASEEYERLLFMRPQNDTLRLGLLRALRLGGQAEAGLRRWADWTAAQTLTAATLREEYAKLLLFSEKYSTLEQYSTQENQLEAGFARRMTLYSQMLQQAWPAAQNTLNTWPENARMARKADMERLVQKGLHTRYKKPGVAMALSFVLPGAGKAYSNQWKDGAISLLFVGLNTWQAYRRFDQEGLDTFWGWIHGGFALGFYVGNLYGSHKAARLYNEKKRRDLYHETKQIVFPAVD